MNTKDSLYKRIQLMEIGDIVTVSVDEYAYNTVRRYSSDFGLALNRKYTCHLDRASRLYNIHRLS